MFTIAKPNIILRTCDLNYAYLNIALSRTRNVHRYSVDDTGVKYDGFTYYKRFQNEPEPNVTPSKLFLVKRIKPVKGNPHWDKNILRCLKLYDDDVAIVKNIPENNARLWRVKHLVEIKAINFVNGEPTEEDIGYTWLRANGDLTVVKKLGETSGQEQEQQERLTDVFLKDPKRIDGHTLRRQSRQKWLDGW